MIDRTCSELDGWIFWHFPALSTVFQEYPRYRGMSHDDYENNQESCKRLSL